MCNLWRKKSLDFTVRIKHGKKETRNSSWEKFRVCAGLFPGTKAPGLKTLDWSPGFEELLQHNLPNIDRVALRIDDVHEVQAIAAPAAEAERIALLADVGLEYLLPDRVFDAQLVAVHEGEVAVIDGEGAAGRVREYLDGIGIGRWRQLGDERVDDERIGNGGEHGIVNGNYILNGNGIVNGKGAGVERIELIWQFRASL